MKTTASSFEAFYRATVTLAHALMKMGVQKGDRVALVMRNLPEWPVIFYAAEIIGAIVTPLECVVDRAPNSNTALSIPVPNSRSSMPNVSSASPSISSIAPI